jgi:UDP-glucose 4-epimerase
MRSGEADADRALAVNVAGFRNTLEAARQADVARVLWSSSTVVYGPPETYRRERVDEAEACRPRTFYGLTKLMAEELARFYRDRHGVDVVGLRLPLVIGPGLWYHGAAAELARLFAEARPRRTCMIAGPPDPADLMYVKDVARAFLAASAAPTLDAVYNINGFTASYEDVIAAVCDVIPEFSARLEPRDPPFRFPLVSADEFVRKSGCRPAFDLAATVADFLREARAGEGV